MPVGTALRRSPPGKCLPARAVAAIELAATVRTAEPLVDVQAKNRLGRVLGTAKALEPRN
jgi:hypothetical protein